DKPVNFCKPSIDVLFFSAADVYKNRTLGIILTGLGDDGARGLKAIKSNGGKTIAESEETSIIYGMPKAAVKIGAAKIILPNYEIPKYMMNHAKRFN
ncbi:MAG: CheB methylesterase domain-containing protein, partial [Candidatus Thorarchaeota archaeon]